MRWMWGKELLQQVVLVKNKFSLQTILYLFSIGTILPLSIYCQTFEQGDKLRLLEAIHTALVKNPSILVAEKQEELQRATWQRTSGQFDWTLSSDINYIKDRTPLLSSYRTENISEFVQEQTRYGINLSKQLHSGISINTSLNLSRITDQFQNVTSPNYANFYFLVQIPLAKGRGRKAAAVNETTAQIGFETSKLDRYHTASVIVFNTVKAYWSYLAAIKRYEILKESELRSQKLVNEIRILVDAGERPRAELHQPLANLADKAAARIRAEQSLFEARQNLGLVMGLSAKQSRQLGYPFDNFPDIKNKIDSLQVQDFIDQALQHRADLQSILNEQKSAHLLWEAAIANSRPQIDLNIKLGYTGLNEGTGAKRFFTALNENTTGANINASVVFTLPTNSYIGAALQQNARYQQAYIRAKDLARTIRSEVVIALNDLERSASQLKRSQESIQLYRFAVDNEEKKLQQGLSTVIELLFTEDRLTNALLNMVSAQLQYAIAIANVHFQTGRLISWFYNTFSVREKILLSFPADN